VTATAPFVWSRFGEWCPAGIVATPLVALPVAWTLLFGWAWIVAPALVPEALLDAPLRATIALLELVDRAPGSPCPLPPAAVRAARRGRGARAPRAARARANERGRVAARLAVPLGALLGALLVLPWTVRPSACELHALDVGGGTCVALRTLGGAVWVFDAGSRDRPGVDREALGPLLRTFDAAGIGVVLSHTDRDHDGALPWLVERFPPAVWAGAVPAHLAARLPHTCARVDAERGAAILPSLDRGAEPLVLEIARGSEEPGNEGSIALEVAWRGQRAVLCGDAEEDGLAAWLRGRPERGPARVLLLPHHGSDTEHLARLLAAVRPAEAWISASGAPVLGPELDRRGLPWRATGVHGPLRIDLR
jgi:beta-lactamase superfamily II metal-dependent hydrolase